MAPRIQIHIWGGFGSQLYGLAVAYQIQSLKQSKRITLVFHTAGVTKRELEICEFIGHNFSIRVIDDFAPATTVSAGNIKRSLTRDLFKGILKRLKLIMDAESIDDLTKIAPWTLQVRGHYSHICFDPNVIGLVAKSLIIEKDYFEPKTLAIHFRLGDLMFLDKASVSSVDISDLAIETNQINKIDLYSETPTEALKRIKNMPGVLIQSHGSETSTVQVLRSCVNANFFVGTNSKVSFWTVIFRCYQDKSHNYLPKSQRENIYRNLDDSQRKLVTFF